MYAIRSYYDIYYRLINPKASERHLLLVAKAAALALAILVLIIDDTPETVILSAYSPLRREIAKQSLERLITDGRIHPARIEDIVAKVEKEMEVKLRQIGEQASYNFV